MSKLDNLGDIVDRFILDELRHSLCNYANKRESTLYKGTIITVRHAINTFFEGQFFFNGLCDISIKLAEDIPDEEWTALKLKLFIFIDHKLEGMI